MMGNGNISSSEGSTEVRTTVRSSFYSVISRIIMIAFGAIEVFIAGRFFLMLTDANGKAGLVKFVYGVSDFFMVPFDSIFKTQRAPSGSVFEWSALVAIITYALIGWGLSELIRAAAPRNSTHTVERVASSNDSNR